ncbi:uncharacterized protein MYCFIDRAFT_204924 [Pseudocercospora fijiensis CIRAD86]|uniref:Uncharacterized protein n=1 Tax=Pseudocercospora fijiensis (strain CIRAD86) TaxID=383855 RepID=M3ARP9_PSEFD|nr:uncharacterized protein MYCFIDRAFT_204924 [Pseudocercospora fijiensis CIRAD86]EME79738.1 hypothetical protein MYCFIDRAFT_204924 [Pseudocercospora fijiensis CIRAD86]
MLWPPPDTVGPPGRPLRIPDFPPLTRRHPTSHKQSLKSLPAQGTNERPLHDHMTSAQYWNFPVGQAPPWSNPSLDPSDSIFPNYTAGTSESQYGHEISDARKISDVAPNLFGQAQKGVSVADSSLRFHTGIDEQRREASNQQARNTSDEQQVPEEDSNLFGLA